MSKYSSYTPAQISAMSLAEVDLLTQADVAGWTPEQVKALRADQIGRLSVVAITGLGKAQIMLWSVTQISALDINQVAKLSVDALAGLTAAQLVGLSSTRKSLKLDGSVNSFINIADPRAALVGKNFTIEMRMRIDNPASNWVRLFDMGNGSSRDNLVLSVNGGKLKWMSLAGSTRTLVMEGSTDLSIGSPIEHMFSVVVSGTSVTVYMDGKQEMQGTMTAVLGDIARGGNYIGRSSWSSDPITQGTVRDIRVWSTARTSTEVMSGIGGITANATGLNIWYPGDEQVGTTLVDRGTTGPAQLGSAVTVESAKPVGVSGLRIAEISTTTIAGLTMDQLGGLSATVIAGLIDSQVKAITVAAIAGLTAAQISGLTLQSVAALSTGQVKAITAGAMVGFTAAQLKELTPANIAVLSIAQVKAITETAMAGLTAAQLKELTPANIAVLSIAQVKAITPGAMVGLSVAQLKELTPANIAVLDSEQVNAINQEYFGIAQLAVLSVDAVAGLSGIEVRRRLGAQTMSLDTKQVGGLSINVLAGLDAVSLMSFSDAQLSGITSIQAAALQPNVVSGLNKTQLGRLPVSMFSGFTANQLNVAQMPNLTDVQFGALPIATVASLSDEQLKALSLSAMAGIKRAQALMLSSRKLALFNKNQLKAMSVEGVSTLTTEYIRSLQDAPLPTQMFGLTFIQYFRKVAPNIDIVANNVAGKVYEKRDYTNPQPNDDTIYKIIAEYRDVYVPAWQDYIDAPVHQLSAIQISALAPSCIGGLTAAELFRFTEGQLKGLTAFQLLEMSSDQIGLITPTRANLLSESAKRGLTGLDVTNFTALQIEALSERVVSRIITTSFAGLTPTVFSTFSLKQLSSLTSSQVQALSVPQIQALLPAKIESFSVDGVSGFTTAHLRSISADQRTALTVKQIENLAPNALRDLTSTELFLFNNNQLQSLTAKQIGNLVPGLIASLAVEQFAKFSPKSLGILAASALSVVQIENITGDQFTQLNSTTVGNFSDLQFNAIKPARLAVMSAGQFNALSDARLLALTKSQVESLNLQEILTAANDIRLAKLSPEGISGLSDLIVKKISTDAVSKFTSVQVKALSDAATRSLTIPQIKAMASSAVSGFTKKQIEIFSEQSIAALSNDQLRNLSDEGLAGLTTKNIVNLADVLLPTSEANLTLRGYFSAVAPAINFDVEGVAGKVTGKRDYVNKGKNDDLIYATISSYRDIYLESWIKYANAPVHQFSARQIGILSVSTVGALTATQLFRFTAEQLKGVTADQLSEMSGGEKSLISAKQLGLLSEAAKAGLAGLNVTGFSVTQLQALSGSKVSNITPESMAALRPADFACFSTIQLPKIVSGQVAKLTVEQMKALNTDQIASFSTNATSGITFAQLSGWSVVQRRALIPEQIAALAPTTISGLNSTQLFSLTDLQLRSVTAKQIALFAPDQIAMLTTDQLAKFSPASLGGLAASALSVAQIETLTPAQFAELSPSTVQSFTDSQFNAIATEVFSAMTPQQLNALSNARLGALTFEQAAALKYTTIMWGLSNSQIPMLSLAGVSGLSATVLGSMFAFGKEQFFTLQQIPMLSTSALRNSLRAGSLPFNNGQIAAMTSKQTSGIPAPFVDITSTQLSYLSKEAIGGLSTDFFNALTPSKWSIWSSKQINSISLEVFSQLSLDAIFNIPDVQRLSLEPKYYSSIASRLTNLTPIQIKKMGPNFFAMMKIEQLLSLDNSQLRAFTGEQIRSSTIELNKLTAVQLSRLIENDYFSFWSGIQLRSLSPLELGNLSADAYNKIVAKNFSGLLSRQISAMSTTVWVGISKLALENMDVISFQSIASAHIKYIPALVLKALAPERISLLTKEQISGMTFFQLNNLTTLAGLDVGFLDKDRKGLTSDQIENLLPDLIKTLDSSQISSLSSVQVGALTWAQVQAFSAEQLRAFSASQITSISDASVIKLLDNQVGAMTASQLTALELRVNLLSDKPTLFLEMVNKYVTAAKQDRYIASLMYAVQQISEYTGHFTKVEEKGSQKKQLSWERGDHPDALYAIDDSVTMPDYLGGGSVNLVRADGNDSYGSWYGSTTYVRRYFANTFYVGASNTAWASKIIVYANPSTYFYYEKEQMKDDVGVLWGLASNRISQFLTGSVINSLSDSDFQTLILANPDVSYLTAEALNLMSAARFTALLDKQGFAETGTSVKAVGAVAFDDPFGKGILGKLNSNRFSEYLAAVKSKSNYKSSAKKLFSDATFFEISDAQKISYLFYDELATGALTGNALSRLTHRQIQSLSATVMQNLTAQAFIVLKTENITLLHSLTVSQIQAVTNTVIDELKSTIKNFSPEQLAAFTGVQIYAISDPVAWAQLPVDITHSYIDFNKNNLNAGILSKLSPAQIGELTPSLIAGFSDDDFRDLETSTIEAFTSEQIAVLKPSQLQAFSNKLGSINSVATFSMSSSQLSGLTLSEKNSLKKKPFVLLTAAEISSVEVADLVRLRPRLFADLSADIISAFTYIQCLNLLNIQHDSLQIELRNNLKCLPLLNMTSKAIATISEDYISLINVTVISGLDATHLSAFTKDQFKKFSQSQIRSLSAQTLSTLSLLTWNNFTSDQLSYLAAAQIVYVPRKILASVTTLPAFINMQALQKATIVAVRDASVISLAPVSSVRNLYIVANVARTLATFSDYARSGLLTLKPSGNQVIANMQSKFKQYQSDSKATRSDTQAMRMVGSIVAIGAVASAFSDASTLETGSETFNVRMLQGFAWLASLLQVPIFELVKLSRELALDGPAKGSFRNTLNEVFIKIREGKLTGNDRQAFANDLKNGTALSIVVGGTDPSVNEKLKWSTFEERKNNLKQSGIFHIANALSVASAGYQLHVALKAGNPVDITFAAINVGTSALILFGDAVGFVFKDGIKSAGLASKLLSAGWVVAVLATSAYTTYKNVKAYEKNPSEGNMLALVGDVINSVVQIITIILLVAGKLGPYGMLIAMAISFAAPAMGVAGAALDMDNKRKLLRSQGRYAEADIICAGFHELLSLTATPVINTFAGIYTEPILDRIRGNMRSYGMKAALDQVYRYQIMGTDNGVAGLKEIKSALASSLTTVDAKISKIVLISRQVADELDYFANTGSLVRSYSTMLEVGQQDTNKVYEVRTTTAGIFEDTADFNLYDATSPVDGGRIVVNVDGMVRVGSRSPQKIVINGTAVTKSTYYVISANHVEVSGGSGINIYMLDETLSSDIKINGGSSGQDTILFKGQSDPSFNNIINLNNFNKVGVVASSETYKNTVTGSKLKQIYRYGGSADNINMTGGEGFAMVGGRGTVVTMAGGNNTVIVPLGLTTSHSYANSPIASYDGGLSVASETIDDVVKSGLNTLSFLASADGLEIIVADPSGALMSTVTSINPNISNAGFVSDKGEFKNFHDVIGSNLGDTVTVSKCTNLNSFTLGAGSNSLTIKETIGLNIIAESSAASHPNLVSIEQSSVVNFRSKVSSYNNIDVRNSTVVGYFNGFEMITTDSSIGNNIVAQAGSGVHTFNFSRGESVFTLSSGVSSLTSVTQAFASHDLMKVTLFDTAKDNLISFDQFGMHIKSRNLERELSYSLDTGRFDLANDANTLISAMTDSETNGGTQSVYVGVTVSRLVSAMCALQNTTFANLPASSSYTFNQIYNHIVPVQP